MWKSLRGRVARIGASQPGFTLVEMLVVVAIIVALAAVIVPTVTVLLDRGEAGAQDAELESIQTAMDALMATNGISDGLEEQEPGDATNDLTDDILDGIGDSDNGNDALSFFFREPSSSYCYTWLSNGEVTQEACP